MSRTVAALLGLSILVWVAGSLLLPGPVPSEPIGRHQAVAAQIEGGTGVESTGGEADSRRVVDEEPGRRVEAQALTDALAGDGKKAILFLNSSGAEDISTETGLALAESAARHLLEAKGPHSSSDRIIAEAVDPAIYIKALAPVIDSQASAPDHSQLEAIVKAHSPRLQRAAEDYAAELCGSYDQEWRTGGVAIWHEEGESPGGSTVVASSEIHYRIGTMVGPYKVSIEMLEGDYPYLDQARRNLDSAKEALQMELLAHLLDG